MKKQIARVLSAVLALSLLLSFCLSARCWGQALRLMSVAVSSRRMCLLFMCIQNLCEMVCPGFVL